MEPESMIERSVSSFWLVDFDIPKRLCCRWFCVIIAARETLIRG
jgi:hypothetical protein